LVAGNVRTRTRSNPNAIERFELLWRFAQEAWVPQGWAATANLLIHADAFEAVGGFDEAYRHYTEDADFCLRAGRAGFGLGYCADAVIEHEGEHRLWPFLRRSVMHGYGSNQAFHRIGAGYRAWRSPRPVVSGDRALRLMGQTPEGLGAEEWRAMSRIARLAYAARIGGSVWAEVVRAR
jgi:GT2 family glycosyltransferase